MAEEKKTETKKIAIVRIRGDIDIRRPTRDTLYMLNLRRVNWARIIDSTPQYMGMLNKIKDFVTWGEIDDATLKALTEKWGKKKKDVNTFKLHPPSRGHKRGGIKKHVNVGGALGYRGKEINTLLAKMAGLKASTKKSESKDGTKKQKDKQEKGN